ncbi:hypothetical protein SOV_33300 [Sporomusa ovata DSM 2662]|uniref:Probable membrane protein yetF n=1 Tax=Sporomusa ovata TaxID=2378 RepID=A0A0U1L2E3_9FIRM|nr:YetF domain-containing protein [Sporomusa ovata]EQB25265.1 hypothetical protein SOV_5c04330 [Sporomusa ovata DSM 2662]CQR73828.1 probable membrane protein yetF [Sporomusa ovata]
MNDLLDIAIRASVAYMLLLLLTRVMGRKQISQLTFFDFVSGIAIGSIAASTLINPTMPIYLGIAALVVWTGWVLATARLTLVNLPARKLVEAEPLMVIHKGKILEEKLAGRNYNINDLLKQLREKSVFDPGQVEVGIIETDGKISILKKSQFQPLTSGDMAVASSQASSNGLAGKELIIDGRFIADNLTAAGLTQTALAEYLRLQGVQDVSEVELMIINPQGQYYIDLKQDNQATSITQ